MCKCKIEILPLFVVLLAVCFPFEARSQSSDSTSLREGVWALQFGIAGSFTLTSFQGSTIGAKYQLSNENAIRGGITVIGYTDDGTGSSYGPSSTTGNSSSSTKSATLSFVLQYLWYMNPNDPVHFYAGLGPSVSYGYNHASSNNYYLEYPDSQGYWIEGKYASGSTRWGIGGAGVVGVEWFACRWLSLHADYNESVQYQWSSTTSSQDESSATYPGFIPNRTGNSSSDKGWTLNSSGVNFGLSVYL